MNHYYHKHNDGRLCHYRQQLHISISWSLIYKYRHIVQSYTKNIICLLPWYCYECVAWVTKPKVTNEWYVSNIAMYYGDTDFIIQTWNFIAYSSTNGHSKCSLPWFAWWQYFISGFHASMLALQATNTEAGSHEHEAKAEPHRAGSVCTAAVQFIPDGMSSTSTSRSSDNYKPALFMSAKLVSTSSSQPINHHEFAACLLYM